MRDLDGHVTAVGEPELLEEDHGAVVGGDLEALDLRGGRGHQCRHQGGDDERDEGQFRHFALGEESRPWRRRWRGDRERDRVGDFWGRGKRGRVGVDYKICFGLTIMTPFSL